MRYIPCLVYNVLRALRMTSRYAARRVASRISCARMRITQTMNFVLLDPRSYGDESDSIFKLLCFLDNPFLSCMYILLFVLYAMPSGPIMTNFVKLNNIC